MPHTHTHPTTTTTTTTNPSLHNPKRERLWYTLKMQLRVVLISVVVMVAAVSVAVAAAAATGEGGGSGASRFITIGSGHDHPYNCTGSGIFTDPGEYMGIIIPFWWYLLVLWFDMWPANTSLSILFQSSLSGRVQGLPCVWLQHFHRLLRTQILRELSTFHVVQWATSLLWVGWNDQISYCTFLMDFFYCFSAVLHWILWIYLCLFLRMFVFKHTQTYSSITPFFAFAGQYGYTCPA